MKVEIHSHTDTYSTCSRMPLRELISTAEACGYDAVFLTDHGKIWPKDELARAQELCGNLKLFSAIEITLPGGYDILVLGAEDKSYETITAPEELFAKACADDLLTVIAHPYRWHDTQPEFCTVADACEILTCNHPSVEMAQRAEAYANDHNMAQVYSGDSHGLNFLNRFWLETTDTFETPQEFRRLIITGKYVNRSNETTTPLPPTYKAATLEELTEEDMALLNVQPTP